MPRLPRGRQSTTLPDHGPEVELAGLFRGTPLELIEYVGEQGIVLALGEGVEIFDDEEAAALRAQWGRGVPASDALKVIASQLGEGVHVLRRGPVAYVLGVPADDDLIARVFHAPGTDAEELRTAVEALATDSAKVAAVGDALVIRDTVAGIANVEALFQSLQSARGQWWCSVQFLEVSATGAERLGIDWTALAEADLSLVFGDGSLQAAELFTARLRGLLELEKSEQHVRQVTSVRLHVVEGRDATFQVGETIPVPGQSTLTDGGALRQDFEEIDTGVLLRVGVRTEPDNRLRVLVEPEISSVAGFIEQRPIRTRRRVQTEAVLEPGGALIVGGFTSSEYSSGSNGLAGKMFRPGYTADRHDRSATRLYIVVRVIDPLQVSAAVAAVPTEIELARKFPAWSPDAIDEYRSHLIGEAIEQGR